MQPQRIYRALALLEFKNNTHQLVRRAQAEMGNPGKMQQTNQSWLYSSLVISFNSIEAMLRSVSIWSSER
jgi:hypothetical protein